MNDIVVGAGIIFLVILFVTSIYLKFISLQSHRKLDPSKVNRAQSVDSKEEIILSIPKFGESFNVVNMDRHVWISGVSFSVVGCMAAFPICVALNASPAFAGLPLFMSPVLSVFLKKHFQRQKMWLEEGLLQTKGQEFILREDCFLFSDLLILHRPIPSPQPAERYVRVHWREIQSWTISGHSSGPKGTLGAAATYRLALTDGRVLNIERELVLPIEEHLLPFVRAKAQKFNFQMDM